MKFRSKPVQLVRNMHEVLKGYHKALESGERYMVQQKEDGVFGFAIADSDGNWEIYSRTGKKFTNCEVLEQQFKGALQEDRVYIFEICERSMSLETLSGIINTNRTKPVEQEFRLIARMHDAIPVVDFLNGYCPIAAQDRYKWLLNTFPAGGLPDASVIACLFDRTETQIRLTAEAIIEQGYEGIVIKRQSADWKAGRKQHDSMKIVRGCDYDLMCVGVEEGLGKREGMVANAICVWRKFGDPDGELVKLPIDLGKGFTDERRIELWKDQGQIVGKVVEVHALQVGSQGNLRIPKVNNIKIDKTEPDL